MGDDTTDAERAAASVLVEVLDRHLPREWKQSQERRDQILEVVVEFLFRTDRSWPTADRQLYAAKRVAERHNVHLNTVQAHCTRELYGTGTGQQTDRFRLALEAIEKDLRSTKSAP